MLKPLVIILVTASCIIASPTPEQIHIAFGGPTSTLLTWASLEKPSSSGIVYFGTNPNWLDRNVTARTTEFKDDFKVIDKNKKRTWIYKATLDNLHAGKVYHYRVENEGNISPMYYFTQLGRTDQSYKYLVYGDMGNTNAHSWNHIQTETDQGNVDLIFHIGDFAYNMHTDQSKYGDTFFNMVQPVAAYYPYMAIPGNHEARYNFSNYVARFNMPNNKVSNHYYSFDLGLTHFIMLSTEFYYEVRFGKAQIQYQYEWLEKDLQIRVGMPVNHKYGLEEILDSYGVDLMIWAHEHSYERLYPIYDRTFYNFRDPYRNPPAPTHIITGSAGCREGPTKFKPNPAPWSAFRSSDYGYSHMNIVNRTHMYFDFKSLGKKGEDKIGTTIDSFWIVRDEHLPYSKSQRALLNGTHVPLDFGMEEEMQQMAVAAQHPDEEVNEDEEL